MKWWTARKHNILWLSVIGVFLVLLVLVKWHHLPILAANVVIFTGIALVLLSNIELIRARYFSKHHENATTNKNKGFGGRG